MKMSAPSSTLSGAAAAASSLAPRRTTLPRCWHASPKAVIALPTGQTPLGLYAELVARAAAKRLSAAQARFFNLDDYLGLSEDHPLSYARFLKSIS